MLFWSRRAPITSPVGVTPGCRLNSSTTLRVSSGNWRTCRSENGLPTEASTVLVAEASEVTLTVSDVLPTLSCKSSVAGVFTRSLTSWRVAVEKPGFSTLTVKVPGATCRNAYSPTASVTTWRDTPLSRSLSVTTEPGITPPWASVTVPRNDVVDCAQMFHAAERKTENVNTSRAYRFIVLLLCKWVQRGNVLAKETWLSCRMPERRPLGLEWGWRGCAAGSTDVTRTNLRYRIR